MKDRLQVEYTGAERSNEHAFIGATFEAMNHQGFPLPTQRMDTRDVALYIRDTLKLPNCYLIPIHGSFPPVVMAVFTNQTIEKN